MNGIPLETAEILAERAPLDVRIAVLNDQITRLQRELAPLWRRSKLLRNELVHRAYLVACPKCGAGSEEPCKNLQNGQAGDKKWPHQHRLDAFASAAGVSGGLDIWKESE